MKKTNPFDEQARQLYEQLRRVAKNPYDKDVIASAIAATEYDNLSEDEKKEQKRRHKDTLEDYNAIKVRRGRHKTMHSEEKKHRFSINWDEVNQYIKTDLKGMTEKEKKVKILIFIRRTFSCKPSRTCIYKWIKRGKIEI